MKRLFQVAAGILLTLAGAGGADKKAAPAHAVPKGDSARPMGPNKRGGGGIAGAAGSPLARWNQMTPEQREKQLSKLPPERQQQIRERLEKFNSLPPEERERLQRRYDRFNSLPADKQDVVRRQIRSFSQLPQDRRPEVSREFSQLRRMSPEERQSRLNSDEFRSRFNPQEREILRDLSENLSLPPQK